MNNSLVDVDGFAEIVADAAHSIAEAYKARGQGLQGNDVVTPELLTEALEQFAGVMKLFEQGQGEGGAGSIFETLTEAGAEDVVKLTPVAQAAVTNADSSEVTRLGEYGMSLLADLAQWAALLEQTRAKQQLDSLAVPLAQWTARHGGEIHSLEAVVNALAALANTTADAALLAQLASLMGEISAATSAAIKQDLEKGNPGRPWRVLMLNRAIVATRSFSPQLMRGAFDDLVGYLPGDASEFFRQGMQQVDMMQAPQEVRDLMQEYFKKHAAPGMH